MFFSESVYKIRSVLTLDSQLAGCHVAADTVGRHTLVLAFVLGEYLVDRQSGHSIFILEINDLRRAQRLR